MSDAILHHIIRWNVENRDSRRLVGSRGSAAAPRAQWNSARNAGRNKLYDANANEVHTAHTVDHKRML